MPIKKIEKVVNNNEPVRAGLLADDTFMAPATPHGRGRTTAREERIKEAYHQGADLDVLVRNSHVHPSLLFRILELDLADNQATYAKLLAEYDDLRARALR